MPWAKSVKPSWIASLMASKRIMDFGMIGYVIPLETYPKTYNGHPLQYAALASQKNYMSLYLMCIYAHEESRMWFMDELEKRGKKLNIGKACIRFKKLEDLPLDLVGERPYAHAFGGRTT